MKDVFVYGSLKKGYPNNYWLAESQMVKSGYVIGKLYSLGYYPAYKLPTFGDEGCGPVYGEVYQVNDDVLKDLDRLEGHPNFYKRTGVILDDKSVVETYVYQGSIEGRELLTSGIW